MSAPLLGVITSRQSRTMLKADTVYSHIKREGPQGPLSLYYLPRQTEECLISYEDEITLTVVCSSSLKTITFERESGLYSACVAQPELYLVHNLLQKEFSLLHKEGDSYAPYQVANVYKDGTICFGDLVEPLDARQAWNYFWETPFNDDNSEFYDYHNHCCGGAVSHSYAGHRMQPCFCACCLDICICPCSCNMSELFIRYMQNYIPRKDTYKKNKRFAESLRFKPETKTLLVCPRSRAKSLGLKEGKYPDIFISVVEDNDTNYVGIVQNTEVLIPKGEL